MCMQIKASVYMKVNRKLGIEYGVESIGTKLFDFSGVGGVGMEFLFLFLFLFCVCLVLKKCICINSKTL